MCNFPKSAVCSTVWASRLEFRLSGQTQAVLPAKHLTNLTVYPSKNIQYWSLPWSRNSLLSSQNLEFSIYYFKHLEINVRSVSAKVSTKLWGYSKKKNLERLIVQDPFWTSQHRGAESSLARSLQSKQTANSPSKACDVGIVRESWWLLSLF